MELIFVHEMLDLELWTGVRLRKWTGEGGEKRCNINKNFPSIYDEENEKKKRKVIREVRKKTEENKTKKKMKKILCLDYVED